MALRLHQRLPQVVDNSFLEALHTLSVKKFGILVSMFDVARHIQWEPEGTSQAPNILGERDWERVLDGEEYGKVDIRGFGEYKEYGDKWDYWRLRVDCKHRIEFMINFTGCDGSNLEPFRFEGTFIPTVDGY